MHSRTMSRRSSALEAANVGIGTDFKPIRLDQEKLHKSLDELHRRKGIFTLNKKNRVIGLYRKWKRGLLDVATAKNVYRDHKVEFDAFQAKGMVCV